MRCSLNTPQRLNDRVVHRIHDRVSCRGFTAHCDDVHILQGRKTLLRAEYEEMRRDAAASEDGYGETRVDGGDLARKARAVVGDSVCDAIRLEGPNGFFVGKTGGLV